MTLSEAVTERARAKINLALRVIGRRADGYHELDSVVSFAEVGDDLSFVPADADSFSIGGPFAAQLGDGTDNIVIKSRDLIRTRVDLGPVAVTLAKNLPVASGIGGGSADAAATLRGLNRLAESPLDSASLQELALKLGADVPVCIAQSACRMRGVGEIITAFTGPLPASAVLINPLAALATKDVFAALGLMTGQAFNQPLDTGSAEGWNNDLAAPAIRLLPVIADVLCALDNQKLFSAVRMSGSGATCFGLVDDHAIAQRAESILKEQHPNWWVTAAQLS